MSDTWGLPDVRPSPGGAAPGKGSRKTRVPPKVAAAAHGGIVRIHVTAIGIWLLVVVVVAALNASGRELPPLLVIGALAAAAGHALFLSLHLVFAAAARKRAAQQAPVDAVPADAVR